MPLYIITLAARTAGTSEPFQNRTVKLSAGLALDAINAAKSHFRGQGFELKADAEMPMIRRMPDGYPEHSPGLGN